MARAGVSVAMEVHRVRLGDEVVAPLLGGLTDEYHARYGENAEMARTTEEEFDPPTGLFVVVMDGRATVAGGGFRRHDTRTCEIKRMWTSPPYRRRGLARVVLTALEDAAAEAGYERLILETGPLQPEAVAFYAGRGYERIDVYGPYPDALAFGLDLTGT